MKPLSICQSSAQTEIVDGLLVQENASFNLPMRRMNRGVCQKSIQNTISQAIQTIFSLFSPFLPSFHSSSHWRKHQKLKHHWCY